MVFDLITKRKREMSRLAIALAVIIALWICIPGGVNGADTDLISLKPVVVTASRLAPGFPVSSRVVNVLTRKDLTKLPAGSLQEALRYLPGVDIKSRNPFGVQGDVSIRGSTFSQVLILVDGIRVNDPQTGHHNLNLGVPLDEVERVEVLQGPGAAFYGADAVGGVINIITRKPEKNTVSLKGVRLENNAWSGEGSVSLAKTPFFLSGTVSEDSSSGFQHDTDYRVFNAAGKMGWKAEKVEVGISYNYLDKEFGAFDFYTPGLNFPSREWNRAHLVSGYGIFRAKNWTITPRAYYRHHFDEFSLDEERPDYYNNKTRTDLSGGSISARGELGPGEIALGVEYQEDSIDSNGLGDHGRSWVSGFGEWGFSKDSRFFLNAGFRLDRYYDYDLEFNPTVGMSFWPVNSLNLRISAGRSFRVPSYTELYYNSPANKGNPDLDPEHAWSIETGMDYNLGTKAAYHFTFFYRDETDIIDWVRYPADSYWKVINSGDVEALGLETGVEFQPCAWVSGSIFYDYLDKSVEKEGDYLSKYVLNYPRHQVKIRTEFLLPFGCSMTVSANYQDRVGLDRFWVLDGKFSKRFRNFEVFLTGSNLTNESYQEIPGLNEPGRRAGIGIRTFLEF